MRVKKKRAPKPKTELTEEELLQAKARAMAEGAGESQDLNESIYSYYTEKTDLNESVMAAAAGADSAGVISPDKRGRSPSAAKESPNTNVKVLAELESSTDPKLEKI